MPAPDELSGDQDHIRVTRDRNIIDSGSVDTLNQLARVACPKIYSNKGIEYKRPPYYFNLNQFVAIHFSSGARRPACMER